jgi:hypothetical protein
MPEDMPNPEGEQDQPAGDSNTDHELTGQDTLTQEAVNKLVGYARVEARKAFLKKHGFSSEDEFAAAVKKAKEIEEAQLTELEKAQKQLDEMKAAAEAARAEAEALKLAGLRAKIGREKGLPEPLIEKLVATDEEGILAEVETLLPFVKGQGEEQDLGGGTNPPGAVGMGLSAEERWVKGLIRQVPHR